jgi:hypothetical protein
LKFPPSRDPKRRRLPLLLLVVALAVVAAGLYAAYWHRMTGNLRARTIEWMAAQQKRGVRITHADVVRSGFPLSIAVRVVEPAIAPIGDTGSVPWTWTSEDAVVDLGLFPARRIVVDLSGSQRLTVGPQGLIDVYEGSVARMTAQMGPGRTIPHGTLAIRGLDLASPSGSGGFVVESLDLETAQTPPSSDGAPPVPAGGGTDIKLVGTGFRPPPAIALPLAETIDFLKLDLRLTGPLEDRPWPEAMERWRDAGGTIEVVTLEVVYGPAAIRSEGTFALDRDGQPIGAMSTRIDGFVETIEALRERNVISNRAAQNAETLMDAFTEPAVDGEPTMTVPVALQDRTLSIGPLPLFRVPRVRWLSSR